MAFREIGGQKTYHKLSETKPQTVLVEGIFRREFTGKYGKQYEYEQDSGEIVVLSATGQLRYKMDFIREGDRVKITYEGQEILQNGIYKGRPAHQFTVLRDDEFNESSLHEESEDNDEDDTEDESFDDDLGEL